MGYATVVDVETYAPARAPFTSGGKPSASAVGQLCDDASAQVDRALNEAGYLLPVPTTATVAFELIKTTTAKVAAALVEQVAPQSDRETRSQMMADHALKALQNGELPGVARAKSLVGVRSMPNNATGPVFTRDMDL